MKITVNGLSFDVNDEELTYEAIVKLANKKGNPTVVYSGKVRGDVHREGTMYQGCKPVKLEDDLRFTVMHTDGA